MAVEVSSYSQYADVVHARGRTQCTRPARAKEKKDGPTRSVVHCVCGATLAANRHPPLDGPQS